MTDRTVEGADADNKELVNQSYSLTVYTSLSVSGRGGGRVVCTYVHLLQLSCGRCGSLLHGRKQCRLQCLILSLRGLTGGVRERMGASSSNKDKIIEVKCFFTINIPLYIHLKLLSKSLLPALLYNLSAL